MKRLRMAAYAAVAGLPFIPGCCCFDGQLLNRMFPPPQNGCCECSTCSSAPVISDGPLLGEPYGPYMNQPPGVQEVPGSRIVPQAQPLPASPVSTTKR